MVGSLLSIAGTKVNSDDSMVIHNVGYLGYFLFITGIIICFSSSLIKDNRSDECPIELSQTPIFSNLEWHFDTVLPKHFELKYKDRIVATMNLKSVLRYDFEGQFDDVLVRVDYHSWTDRATITNKTSNEVIGIIDNFLSASKLTLKDGSVFTLESRKKVGFVLSDERGNIIGLTDLRLWQKPIVSKFTLYREDPRLPSPWLVALLTFYKALISSSGTVA
jgi:hypothetical protein